MSASAAAEACTGKRAHALPVDVYDLGIQPYSEVLDAMHAYTAERGPDSRDQIWLTQHPAVFTQGQAGRPEHLLDIGDIPLVQSDRGGQVTYHGPGQLVAYVLLDIKRLGVGVRGLVSALESSIIGATAAHTLEAYARPDAPGVYIRPDQQGEMKIASLGLRVRRGCSFHGVAYNINMDLAPFLRIDPCGYAGMRMTQLKDWTRREVSVASEVPLWLDAFEKALYEQGVAWQLALTLCDGLPQSLAHKAE